MKAHSIFSLGLIATGLLFLNLHCPGDNENEGCDSYRNSVSQRGELLVDGSTMWTLSVANQNGAILVAEKNCHAKMQLEFWFKDKTLAKTQEKPPLSIVFFGGGGFFDPGSVAVYSKLMYDSTYLWTAYCEQGARNAAENPCDYGISVTWDYNQLLSLHDVELDGMINYRVYKGDMK